MTRGIATEVVIDAVAVPVGIDRRRQQWLSTTTVDRRDAVTEIEARRPEAVAQQDAHLQWGAVGMLVAMSSAGAFLVGWIFARRWIRFIGW